MILEDLYSTYSLRQSNISQDVYVFICFFRSFRKVMHDCNNYHAFSLDTATRSWMIALRVWKRLTQVPYRCSRAGQRLFHCIATIQRQNATDGTHGQLECNQVNYNNLIRITVSNNRNIYLKVSHINARSIYHKMQPFQEHILAKDVSSCAITQTGYHQIMKTMIQGNPPIRI